MTDDEQAQEVMAALAPCRTWVYMEPVDPEFKQSRSVIITDREILAKYWNYWCDQMHRALKSDDICEESCIQDFVTVSWAWELK